MTPAAASRTRMTPPVSWSKKIAQGARTIAAESISGARGGSASAERPSSRSVCSSRATSVADRACHAGAGGDARGAGPEVEKPATTPARATPRLSRRTLPPIVGAAIDPRSRPLLHLSVVFLSTQLCVAGGIAGNAAWKQALLAIPLPQVLDQVFEPRLRQPPRHPGRRAFLDGRLHDARPDDRVHIPFTPVPPLVLTSHTTIRRSGGTSRRKRFPKVANPGPW